MFQNTIILSCSLDSDQDLQSGSKLFTWYDVIEWGGGGGGGGGYVLVVKFSGRNYVLVVKFTGGGGGLCPSCKIHGGDFVHVYKNEQGRFCPGGGGGGGGFCPTLPKWPYLTYMIVSTNNVVF